MSEAHTWTCHGNAGLSHTSPCPRQQQEEEEKGRPRRKRSFQDGQASRACQTIEGARRSGSTHTSPQRHRARVWASCGYDQSVRLSESAADRFSDGRVQGSLLHCVDDDEWAREAYLPCVLFTGLSTKCEVGAAAAASLETDSSLTDTITVKSLNDGILVLNLPKGGTISQTPPFLRLTLANITRSTRCVSLDCELLKSNKSPSSNVINLIRTYPNSEDLGNVIGMCTWFTTKIEASTSAPAGIELILEHMDVGGDCNLWVGNNRGKWNKEVALSLIDQSGPNLIRHFLL